MNKSPVPPDDGSRQRLGHLLRALQTLGPIDLLVDRPIAEPQQSALRAAFAASRVWVPDDRLPSRRFSRLRWLLPGSAPIPVALVDRPSAHELVRSFLAAAPEPYDLMWTFDSTPGEWAIAAAMPDLPAIHDLADIRWVSLDRAQRGAPESAGGGGVKRLERQLVRRVERRRWKRFERVQGKRAAAVVVCSETDRDFLGVPGALVIPNGYERPSQPCGRSEVADQPVVVFAGLMTYGPNADGARWFADEILPLVQERIPAVRCLIVGRGSSALDDLAERDGIELTGPVVRIEDVLARADAVVVPLRQGSGTRIKILEAWAHHLPVVSTRVGAEGLGATDGRDLLLADEPTGFARAVERVLTDGELRRRLVRDGAAHFEADYEWATIERRFAAAVRVAVGATA